MISVTFRALRFALLAFCVSIFIDAVMMPAMTQTTGNDWEKEAIAEYQANEWQEAARKWEEAASVYQNQGNSIAQARVNNNLALAYQKLGNWKQAEAAIADSFQLLTSNDADEQNTLLLGTLAQTYNNQGNIELAKGDAQSALNSWQEAEKFYQRASQTQGVLQSQINQAQALHTLGFYHFACQEIAQTRQLSKNLCQEPNTTDKEKLTTRLKELSPTLTALDIKAWQKLADYLNLFGQPKQAQIILENLESLVTTQQQKAELQLSLGKLAVGQRKIDQALTYFRAVESLSIDAMTTVDSQLCQFRQLKRLEEWKDAIALIPTIEANLTRLPDSQWKRNAQLNFAYHAIQLIETIPPSLSLAQSLPPTTKFRQIYQDVYEQAQVTGDKRSQTYALGSLGLEAQKQAQWETAEELTEKALFLAQSLNAPEISYRWKGQLGRILMHFGKREESIQAYSQAIETLQTITGDLAINRELQSSFQDIIEPLYREFVALLLEPDAKGTISQNNLAQARDVMESLQQAELINYLGQDCLDKTPTDIQQLDPQAAVIYPILLPDRLVVILKLPQQQDLTYYSSPISADNVAKTVIESRRTLVIRSRRKFFAPSQQLYDWLIRPAETQLKAAGIKTLVFVPDGVLRNFPPQTMFDGQNFLIENYQVAVAPGLELLKSTILKDQKIEALAAGIQLPRQGFSPLYFVPNELASIEEQLPSTVLLDQTFTEDTFGEALSQSSYPLIHIATHAQFSSDINQTFLLTWDGKVTLPQLAKLLQKGEFGRDRPLELLFLSACQTAVGDRRAALGLAGTAVQSGARSTVATLWPVNDESSAVLIQRFYAALAKKDSSKGDALREAQLSLLNDPRYRHPFYWAAYILVGNWL